VKLVKWFLVLVVPGLVGLFIGVMLMVAYPNALKVGASQCPDDKPDAFVVRYTVSTSDGEGTNFTLFCMSDRGETEEIGTWLPLLVLCAYTTIPLYVLVLFALLRRLVRAITGGGGSDPPGDGAGIVYRSPGQGDQPPDPFAGLAQPPPSADPPFG
jgi:hypothetical protein